MAAALTRINPVVSTPLRFNSTLPTPQIRPIPTPTFNIPPTIPSAKFSLPSWTKTAKDFFPVQQTHYGSAVLLGLGILALGLGLYGYLNSQGIRPDQPEHIQPISLRDYLVVQ